MRGKKINSHKEHGKLGNPNPIQTQEFLNYQQKPVGGEFDEPFSKKTWGFKLPESFSEKLEAMEREDRIVLIRNAVMDAIAKKDSLN
jgi:hypothetical protein